MWLSLLFMKGAKLNHINITLKLLSPLKTLSNYLSQEERNFQLKQANFISLSEILKYLFLVDIINIKPFPYQEHYPFQVSTLSELN